MLRREFTALLPAALLASTRSGQPPRVHGPRVYGARPGRPFLYRIPATGAPLTFTARNLPAGLAVDASTGIISGALRREGTFDVMLEARNAHGTARRPLRIVGGEGLALTPPMGWSTWFFNDMKITDAEVREQAAALVSCGLAAYGYSWVNIDDGWTARADAKDPRERTTPRDSDGNLLPNAKFPDMRALCDYVHSLGLKIGIYSSPGPLTCAGYTGSYGHEEQDARQFSKWGFDFLKYDWCSYKNIAPDPTLEQLQKPYREMGRLLRAQDRDIVFSLCQYGMGDVWKWGRDVGGHLWRTTMDIGPTEKPMWESMTTIGFGHAGREQWIGPGGWNDPDHLIVGKLRLGEELLPTPMNRDEQRTQMTLWCMLAAPLILGCDMTVLDRWTFDLLTNEEVLDVDQDPLGKQASRVAKDGDHEVWAKPLEGGALAVALFNRGEEPAELTARWPDLGLRGERRVRDLWARRNLGRATGSVRSTVPRHGSVLLRIG